MRVGLVSCCKTKLDHPAPARELYTSTMFRYAVQWIENSHRCDEWAILSAKHGLVLPDQVISPYDVYLGGMIAPQRKAWVERTRKQILDRWGPDTIYLVLMGHDYKTALRGLMVEDPIECWTQWRINRGMTRRRAAMGIGLILKALKEQKPYY